MDHLYHTQFTYMLNIFLTISCRSVIQVTVLLTESCRASQVLPNKQ